MVELNDLLTNMVEQAEKARQEAEHPANKRVYKKEGQRGSVMADVPLTREAIPSLLTRAKLSPATRAAEERRLKEIEDRKKKRNTKKSRGIRHWKKKAANRKKRLRKIYEANAGFGAILRSRGYKKIDPVLWDRYIGECFREYSPEYLTIKKIKRYPGKGDSAYYGTRKYPLTVYSYNVEHSLLGRVYDGRQQMAADMKAGVVTEEQLIVDIEKPAG